MALFNKQESQSHVAPTPRPMQMSGSPMQLNIIGQGAVFEGVMRAKSDTSISGKVIGKIFVEGRLVIAAEGIVEGEINATNADIAGKILGDVNVDERLTIKGTGMVDGNIKTKKLAVEDGAIFTGKCSMTSSEIITPKVAPGGNAMAPKLANEKVG
jgi:cytoskeletal protein CcmA (bactofilin family)